MIVAKPIIPNQFWILKENDRKIGNIESGPGGYSVKINNQIKTFKTINNIKKQVDIDFQSVTKKISEKRDNSVYGYETSSKPYNAIYDVKHQVPLWTRDEKSKSWYAAGWYQVKQGRSWQIVFCPKLITLQRYKYQGPFFSREQANDKSVS